MPIRPLDPLSVGSHPRLSPFVIPTVPKLQLPYILAYKSITLFVGIEDQKQSSATHPSSHPSRHCIGPHHCYWREKTCWSLGLVVLKTSSSKSSGPPSGMSRSLSGRLRQVGAEDQRGR